MTNTANAVSTAASTAGSTEAATETVQEITDTAKKQITWLSNISERAVTMLIKIGICILVYFLVTRILRKVLREFEKYLTKRNVEPTARHFFVTVIYYGVTIFTVVEIIIQLDIVEASSIAALIASAGVGISLALQGVLSNFAGGILLLMLRPFKVGDYIRLKDSSVEGMVEKIEMYYTTIRDVYGVAISIPNSELTGKDVQNLASDGTRGISVTVGISYDEDLKRAEAVLQEIRDEEPRLIKGKGRIYVDSLGESAIVIGIRGSVKTEDYANTLWDLNEKVRLRFEEEGIEIPYNQLDVHIREDSTLKVKGQDAQGVQA